MNDKITFSSLPGFWKVLIIVGSISTALFFILLMIIMSLMLETKVSKQQDLANYTDFLDEFTNGKTEINDDDPIIIDYPILPKIKDFDGNILRDLLDIKLIN